MNASITGFRRLLAVGVAALALTGCIRADFGIELNDDESGTFRVKMLVDRDKMLQLAEMFGEDETDDPCATIVDDPGELPDDATVTDVTDGGWCGVDISMPFDSLAELASLTSEFNDEADSDDDPSPFGNVNVTKADGGYRFAVADVAMSSDAMGVGEGIDADGMGELANTIEKMLGNMQVTYVVRLPGRPVDHNADAVAGNTFTYVLEYGDTRTELFAHTGAGEPDGSADVGDADLADEVARGADSSDSGSRTALWILLALVAAAAIAAIVFLKRRKAAAAATGAPEGGGGAPGKSFDEVTSGRDDPFGAPTGPPAGTSTESQPGSSFDDIVERTRTNWEPPADF